MTFAAKCVCHEKQELSQAQTSLGAPSGERWQRERKKDGLFRRKQYRKSK